MTEPKIRDYLLGLIDASELVKDDRPVSTNSGEGVYAGEPYWKSVKMIEEGEFIIQPKHLIAVCDDVLMNRMAPETLDLFAFILIGSDYFALAEDTGGER